MDETTTVTDAPADELVFDMIAVARDLHLSNRKVSFACPICLTRMSIASETTLSEFGDLDIKLHQLECGNCGMRTDRAFHPAVGYKTISR